MLVASVQAAYSFSAVEAAKDEGSLIKIYLKYIDAVLGFTHKHTDTRMYVGSGTCGIKYTYNIFGLAPKCGRET